jgi:hypothetical protein
MADLKAPSTPTDVRLLSEIDAALRPARVLRDLSRIIAQFARPPVRWVEDPLCTVAVDEAGAATLVLSRSPKRGFVWAFSDVSIGQLPNCMDSPASSSPSSSSVTVGQVDAPASSLRAWTVRIDRSIDVICMGVAKPSSAPGYDVHADERAISISTANSHVFTGHTPRSIALPFASYAGAAVGAGAGAGVSAGALYHFTADLATGTLRVRPVIPLVSRHYRPPAKPQTEWTLAQGISDLADYRVTVAVCYLLDGCSLLTS